MAFWSRILKRLTGDLNLRELLKHEFYLTLKNFGRESYSNNFIKCVYNRARCILIHNFIELGKICASKVYRRIKSPLNRLKKRPLMQHTWDCLLMYNTSVNLMARTVTTMFPICLFWKGDQQSSHHQQHQHKHHHQQQNQYRTRLPLRRSNVTSIERARTRTLRMTFIIVLAFISCWTPYAMGTLWWVGLRDIKYILHARFLHSEWYLWALICRPIALHAVSVDIR